MKKMNIFKAYGLMWRNIFNYRGISGRREYWFAVLAEAVIAAVGGCLVAPFCRSYGGLEDKIRDIPHRLPQNRPLREL